MPGEEIIHYYHKVANEGPPMPILSGDLREWNIRQFFMRMVCTITKSSTRRGVSLAYTIIICLGNKDEIGESSPLSQQPGWPGIKVQ